MRACRCRWARRSWSPARRFRSAPSSMPKAWPTRLGRRSWCRTPTILKARPTATSASCSARSFATRSPPASRSPRARSSAPTIAASLPRRLARACAPSPFPVSATSGVAGFVFPGDRVDMVLTQEVIGGGDGPALKVSETIVRNLRVLATDQRIDSKDEEGKTEVKTFATVTLEATPRIAEKIAVAQSHGHAVAWRCARSPTIRPNSSVRLPPARSRFPAGTNPAEERKMLLAVANRPSGQQHDLSSPAATCRASSAAASRPTRRRPIRPAASQVRSAMGRASPQGPAAPRCGPVRSFALLAAILSLSFRWGLAKMTSNPCGRARLGTALAALALGLGTVAVAAPAAAAPPAAAGTYRPSTAGSAVGRRRPDDPACRANVANVWTSNPTVADVYVANPRQINLFGKDLAKRRSSPPPRRLGRLWRQRPGQPEHTSVDKMLQAAMPDANIQVTTVGQMAVLNGTVASPEDSAQAEALVRPCSIRASTVAADAALKICRSTGCKPRPRCRSTSRCRIAEVSRDLLKQIGVNLLPATRPAASSSASARAAGNHRRLLRPNAAVPPCLASSATRSGRPLGLAGKLFGLDILSRSTSPKAMAW